MKKPKRKRFFITAVQQLMAAGIFVAIGILILNSNIKVESIDGTRVYKILPTKNGEEFEDSEVYQDLFRNTVSDIIQYASIRELLETDGVFDPSKEISVTDYAVRIGADKGCAITAIYPLDDLIKWGKYGVGYQKRLMRMSEFINFFGYCIYPENFTLDEYGQLCFDGFYRLGKDSLDTGEFPISPTDENTQGEDVVYEPAYYGKSIEEVEIVRKELEEADYSEAQLEDMVLAYIMSQNLEGLEYSREGNNRSILVSLLTERYAFLGEKTKLMQLADNWVDYMRLQSNVVASVDTLALKHQRYQICREAYRGERSNVKYVVRLMTDEGICTYTNLSEMQDATDEHVTEVFSEYRDYLIYYPDSLVFTGNTFLSEKEIYGYVGENQYTYSDSVHIWIGVDTGYSATGDAFYDAVSLYNRIVPKVDRIVALIISLALCWLGICIYLTVTVGRPVNEDGVIQTNRFDRLWTELLILFAIALGYGGYQGFLAVMNMVENVDKEGFGGLGMPMSGLLQYGVFALYGVYLSLAVSLVWYSLVHRYKAAVLWKGSLLFHIIEGLKKVLRFMLRHRNSVISILLPYNLYLFANLAGVVAVYRLWERQKTLSFAALAAIIIFDGVIGVVMFRSNAERKEIVDAIKKIRDGEVDYKIDVESLHGSGRELADAVNNIGDGIEKAVKTSMKDEQMKTDLITNVSHDIKTPLTSIINYVDLLKRLKIEDDPAKGYIEILDSKSQRLKQLTDDLVEASKISSGNIVLNRERLNLTELLNQGIGEFSEKLEESGLQVVFESSDRPGFIYADSRRMWRIVENLMTNVCKYALAGTRIYIDVMTENGRVEASVKNISRQQMNISPEELTERFIRGDSARSTEGSGLGLSIAQSLTRVQGGEFEIYLDGDLFKVTLNFPVCPEA